MNRTELRALLEEIGVRPSRRLGQNFLVDRNLLEALVREAGPVAGERILEIGPGTGAMTAALLDRGVRLLAVEYDHRLAAYLRRSLAGRPGFELLEADACQVDYGALLGDGSYRCVANLPYSCGSVFLARIAFCGNAPRELFVLLQKEMGDRLVAGPGGREYGSLTVRLSWIYETAVVRTVPPEVFFPSPEVTSVLLRMTRRERLPGRDLLLAAEGLVLAAFSQRRKKVLRLLAARHPRERLAAAFAELGLAEDLRAEHIAPDQYLRLAEILLRA